MKHLFFLSYFAVLSHFSSKLKMTKKMKKKLPFKSLKFLIFKFICDCNQLKSVTFFLQNFKHFNVLARNKHALLCLLCQCHSINLLYLTFKLVLHQTLSKHFSFNFQSSKIDMRYAIDRHTSLGYFSYVPARLCVYLLR